MRDKRAAEAMGGKNGIWLVFDGNDQPLQPRGAIWLPPIDLFDAKGRRKRALKVCLPMVLGRTVEPWDDQDRSQYLRPLALGERQIRAAHAGVASAQLMSSPSRWRDNRYNLSRRRRRTSQCPAR
jgi:hypothetical protein